MLACFLSYLFQGGELSNLFKKSCRQVRLEEYYECPYNFYCDKYKVYVEKDEFGIHVLT